LPRRPDSAFTLVELLVVITIIALLVAILLPSLKKSRDQAKRAVCAARLREIGSAIWSYGSDNNGRVPYVISPMNNGTGVSLAGQPVPGFGDPNIPDDEIDPFNRHPTASATQKQGWPHSLPNVLSPAYLGSEQGVFACPAALRGWPRDGSPLRMTYRPAAANQLTGDEPQPAALASTEFNYNRDHFGFLDGRIYRTPEPVRVGGTGLSAIIRQAQENAALRGTFVRDLVIQKNGRYFGPHNGGNNVINKRLEVEFRDQKTTDADLTPNGLKAVEF